MNAFTSVKGYEYSNEYYSSSDECYKYIIDRKREYSNGTLRNINLMYNGSMESQIVVSNSKANKEYSQINGCI